MIRWPVATAAGVVLVAAALGCQGRDEPAPAPQAPAASPVAASAGCRQGVELNALRGIRREIRVGEEVRSYLLDVPRGPADTPRPVLLAFHGFRAAPGRLRRWTGLARQAHRTGMIAAFPEGHDGVELLGGSGRGWDMEPGETRDLAFVTALLDTLEQDWCVDRQRIYVTGMSNGGFFANLLGCVLADRLAAVAAVAGAKPLPSCTGGDAIPMLLIHGAKDKVVDPALARSARDWWMQRNGCSGSRQEQHCMHAEGCRADVSYCEATQGHWWPRPATRRIIAFFERHARG
jgi:poly(3-hydroxybutyrate) depolymerase